MTSTRLSKIDWLQAGFRALKQGGPQAVRAEPLARDLGVSKGSFYHHFKDLPDFHQQMIDHWEAQATGEIIAALEAMAVPAPARMAALIEVATSDQDAPYGGPMTELAIRSWAQHAGFVAQAQARVDRARLDHLEGLFGELSSADPKLHGALFYHSYIGGAHADQATRRAVLTELVARLVK